MNKICLFLIAIIAVFVLAESSEARMYSPSTGRFMEPDPIGQAGATNLYVYTRNNPVNLIDPLGLDPAGPYPGSTNPVTKCHVCPHNDSMENAIGGALIGGPLLLITAPEVLPLLRILPPNPNDPLPPNWTKEWEWRMPEGCKNNTKPRWFDPNGGEWRWHLPDKWHDTGHWDHNPWNSWNSPWKNIYP